MPEPEPNVSPNLSRRSAVEAPDPDEPHVDQREAAERDGAFGPRAAGRERRDRQPARTTRHAAGATDAAMHKAGIADPSGRIVCELWRRHDSSMNAWCILAAAAAPETDIMAADRPCHRRGAAVPRHIVCLTFDFDTQSGFIARGMTTPTRAVARRVRAHGRAADPGLLKSHGLRSTWFTPGFTIESHPKICEEVVAAGHEIGHHSWAHIPPATQTRAEEEADLVRANAAIEKLTGAKARGYRSPSWDLSEQHARSAGGARLPLRLEPDGRRLLALPAAPRRPWPSSASRSASARRRG